MSADLENTRLAKTIFAMLIAGVVISFAVVGVLVITSDGPSRNATSSAEDTVPLVRADRTPVRVPPGGA
jgi:hypothetical protein